MFSRRPASTIFQILVLVCGVLALVPAALAQSQDQPKLTPIGRSILEQAVIRETAQRDARYEPATSGLQPDLTRGINFPFPTCTFPGGLCGAVHRDGSVAVPPRYDWIGNFRQGRALVRLGGLYGYVDETGREIVSPKYEIAGEFHGGYAQFVVGDKMGVLGLNGVIVVPPQFGYVHTFGDNHFWVTKDRRFCETSGINKKGEVWSGRCFPSFGFFAYTIEIGGNPTRAILPSGNMGIIDKSGRTVRNFDILSLSYSRQFFGETAAIVRMDAGWGIIRPGGSWLFEPRFEELAPCDERQISAKRDGKWGVLDREGRWTIANTFDWPIYFETGSDLAVNKVGSRFGLVDRSGKWAVEPKFDGLHRATLHDSRNSSKRWWRISIDGKHGLYDSEAGREILIDANLDQTPTLCQDGTIEGYSEKSIRIFSIEGRHLLPSEGDFIRLNPCSTPRQVKSGTKFGVVDSAMKWIVRPELDALQPFFRGLAPAQRDGKFGVLRADGTWAVNPSFDHVWHINLHAREGYVLVKTGEKVGVIKVDGTIVVPTDYDAITMQSDDRALVKRDGMVSLIDVTTGRVVIAPRAGEMCGLGRFVITAADGKRAIHDGQTGAQLIPPRYERIGLGFTNGLQQVLLNGKWGFADLEGALIIPATAEEQPYFERGIAWMKSGDTWCPIDRHGKAIPGVLCNSDYQSKVVQWKPHVCRVGQ